jgi:hypothetical protein
VSDLTADNLARGTALGDALLGEADLKYKF